MIGPFFGARFHDRKMLERPNKRWKWRRRATRITYMPLNAMKRCVGRPFCWVVWRTMFDRVERCSCRTPFDHGTGSNLPLGSRIFSSTAQDMLRTSFSPWATWFHQFLFLFSRPDGVFAVVPLISILGWRRLHWCSRSLLSWVHGGCCLLIH
jgi:hypothetical protein